MRLAVIPARGGSKRIVGKNIKEFCGKPIIAYSIDAARKSGAFDHVIVSTDDPEIAEKAKSFGAQVPFLRPAELSDDFTATAPVVAHAINAVRPTLGAADAVCCLYATAPFVDPRDIASGLKRLSQNDCSYVVSVTSYAFPIQRALKVRDRDYVEMFQPREFSTRSQDLTEAWHDAGQFYWAKASTWLTDQTIFGPNTVGLPVPRYRVQDIDTLEDWKQAELMYAALLQSK